MPETLPPKPESATTAAGRPIEYARKSPRGVMAERILDASKTLVWVVPLTILIWIYAEREQSTLPEKVTIPISVRINSPNKVVTLNDPADGKIVATLTGPRTSMQALSEQITKSLNSGPILIHPLDASTPQGDMQIPAAVFADNSIFVQNGINVRDISPNSLRVKVDDLVTEKIPVRQPKDLKGLDGEMSFSPPFVTVTAPRSTLEAAKQDKAYVTADPLKLAEYLKTPGVRNDIPGIPVLQGLYSGPNVKFVPTSVSASFIVKQNQGRYVAKNVPIWPSAPEDTLRKYDITIPSGRTLQEVTLVGPDEKINLFKAEIEKGPTGDDPVLLGSVWIANPRIPEQRLKPHFNLPDGIQVDQTQDLSVSVKVTER